MLGSFITEPAAMTVCALLLARQFFDLQPSTRLKYAKLGLLFVNVSIGGTLTQFAAPPVLMVARPWGWDMPFMVANFGWRAVTAIVVSTAVYFVLFRKELGGLATRPPAPEVEQPEDDAPEATLLPVPIWLVVVHLAFMAWTVFNAHDPALFIGGFLFFLGLARATAPYQSRIELKTPLLVGFFLAGLVIHGACRGGGLRRCSAGCQRVPCS
jgi:Na+/H+ antiporter NhaD/arsenite permease-like protein